MCLGVAGCEVRGVSGGVCGTTFFTGEGGNGTRAATLDEVGIIPDEPGRLDGETSLGNGGGGMLGGAALMVRRLEFSSPFLKALCLEGDGGCCSGGDGWLRVFMAASFMTFSPGALRERGLTVPKSQRSSSSEAR